MGQKSNTLTLRKQKECLNLRTANKKEFTNSLEFVNVLKRSLEKKGITVTFYTLNIKQNLVFLTLDMFYKTQKILRYKKEIFNRKGIKQPITVFNHFIPNKILVLKQHLVNKKIDSLLLKELYLKFRNFQNTIFSRRFNLFIDFLKLTTLFIKKEIKANTFLAVLGTIFKVLPKKAHGRFFSFLNYLFTAIVENKKTSICGLKFIINGKLKGKLRSSSFKILVGKIKTQTFKTEIDFAKLHVYTIYGAFGLKI